VSEVVSPGRTAPPARRRRFRVGRLLTGEPGPGPGLALAVLALLGAFIATAGPRELTSLQNTALQQTLRSSGQFGLSASYMYSTSLGATEVTAIQQMGGAMAGYLRPPAVSPAAQRWSGLTAPSVTYPGAPPQAMLSLPPVIEVAYRTALGSHSRLVSGSFPQTAATAKQDGQPVIILQAAVTTTTAGRFGLRVGSQVALSSLAGNTPLVLSVTGLIRPADPGSPFWTQDPSLAAPTVVNVGPSTEWAGGVFVGADEVARMEPAYSGALISWYWQYPLKTRGLTAAQAPGLLAAIKNWINGDAGQAGLEAAGLPGGPGSGEPALSATGTSALTGFIASQAAVATTVSVLLAGIVAAIAILLLVGGVVVTEAYSGELALGRARGGSTRQLALRVLGTTAGVAGPALAAGIAAGVATVPGGGDPLSWILAALVAATTLAAPPLLAAWQHRGLRSVRAAGRGDLVIGRGSPRRLVAETTVLIIVVGGVLAVRLRGLAPGAGFDPYLSSAPVLVAVAAGLIAVRVYPVPLRALLRVTRASRGAVAYLGMARSARSRSVPVLPALALVVALTVIALGGLVRAAVSSGQVTASWQHVGADAVVRDPGPEVSIPATARRRLAAVPGVRLATPVYVIPPGSPSAGQVVGTTAITTSVGVVIADPVRYAAAVADTPWPAFPARVLAPPGGAARDNAPVPVIASPAMVAAVGSKVTELDFLGSQLTVRVVATTASTPALPGGGAFVIAPAWAASRLTFSVAPNTVLLMGASINIKDLRDVARQVLPGSQVVSRAAALQAAAGEPLVRGSDLVFDQAVGAAAGCAVAAVLLGLLLSGRDRTRLSVWLAAMGMTGRQGRRLTILEALPLLLVAILGAEIASLALGPLIGPGLVLSPFTGTSTQVPLRPDLFALVVPAAGALILIMTAAIGRNALTRRRAAGVLRLDE
jgi:putative ABC transport system permease protein